MHEADLAIIGAGVGGYVAAIRASQLGLKVALVERRPTLGGTCLNVGCIPSKALLESSELYETVQHGLPQHGIKVEGTSLDLAAMMQRKDGVVRQLTDGVRQLMKKNRVTVLQGSGRLDGPGRVRVLGEGGEQVEEITARHILLATGSEPVQLPFLPFDGQHVVSSTEALSFDRVPEHLVVVGAGAVGLELGSVWRRLGARVTVVEILPRIVPFADRQVGQTLQRALKAQGLDIRLKTRVTGVRPRAEGPGVVVELLGEGDVREELVADRVLVAVGRKPCSEGLGLETVGLKPDERGRLAVDERFSTSAPGIYALGDLTEGPMLAHRASHEGVALAELLAGKSAVLRRDTIPSVVYTWPELASVGLDEDAAKERGLQVKVGRALFRANGRALTLGHTDGMVKIVADARTDRVLGVHIAGPRASDLIAEAVVALEFSASAEDLARSVHAHPTLSEVVLEAALDVDRRALHA